MNTLVVLSALCAVAFGSAIVHETPAVAAARAAHLAAHAAAAHGRVGVLGVHGIVPAHVGYAGAWAHGPAPIDAHSGVVVDTTEVAHAKAEHLAAVAKARSGAHGVSTWAGSHGVSSWAGVPAWTGVPAISSHLGYAGAWAHGPAPIDAHSGVVVDTPEVAHAKAEHLAAVANARAGAHGVATWTGVPAISAWNAAPAISAWNAAPVVSAWNTVPAVWGATHGHGLHGVKDGQWSAALWGDKSAHGLRWRRSAIYAPAVVSPLAHSVVSPLAHSVAVAPAVTAIAPLTTLHSTHAVSTLATPAVTVGHLGLGHETLLL